MDSFGSTAVTCSTEQLLLLCSLEFVPKYVAICPNWCGGIHVTVQEPFPPPLAHDEGRRERMGWGRDKSGQEKRRELVARLEAQKEAAESEAGGS